MMDMNGMLSSDTGLICGKAWKLQRKSSLATDGNSVYIGKKRDGRLSSTPGNRFINPKYNFRRFEYIATRLDDVKWDMYEPK